MSQLQVPFLAPTSTIYSKSFRQIPGVHTGCILALPGRKGVRTLVLPVSSENLFSPKAQIKFWERCFKVLKSKPKRINVPELSERRLVITCHHCFADDFDSNSLVTHCASASKIFRKHIPDQFSHLHLIFTAKWLPPGKNSKVLQRIKRFHSTKISVSVFEVDYDREVLSLMPVIAPPTKFHVIIIPVKNISVNPTD